MKLKAIYLFIIAALLSVSIYFNIKQLKAAKADANRIEALSTMSKSQGAIIANYVAPDSTQHVVVRPIYAKTDAEKRLAVKDQYIDSINKALNIATNKISELTRIKAVSSATVKTKQETDSLGNKHYTYLNKWLNFNLNASNDSLKYAYNAEFNHIKYHKGNWLTGRKYFEEMWLSDPSAKINGVDRFIEPVNKPSPFGIGFQAGYYYDPIRNQFYPGFGLGLSFNLKSL